MRIIYGINPVNEALKNPEKIERIMVSDSRQDSVAAKVAKAATLQGVAIERLPAKELERIAGAKNHQGVVAYMRGEFRYRDLDDLIEAWKGSKEPAFFLILDSVQDPQNLGSLIRAANAAGVHGVIIPKDRAAEVTPAVVKASAGATESILLAREVNITRTIERLKKENVWVAGIEAAGAEVIYRADLKRDLAIVVGSEGKGIRRLVLENCDFILSIPMAGRLNSLNAAQAGAIALFEARRQRLTK